MKNSMRKKIAVIGGGVAGSTCALYLGKLGANVTLFEKKSCVVSGPPFCHLHAGGNLYREIPISQCIQLLKESIEFLRFYPHGVDFRPTVIAIPKRDSGEPDEILERLKILKTEYEKLIKKDKNNKVLGEPENYYALFSKEKILKLRKKTQPKNPTKFHDWLIPFAKKVDLDKIKFPIVIVNEYGLNLFRIGAFVEKELNEIKNVDFLLNTKVENVEKIENKFKISYNQKSKEFDFVINAAGFNSYEIDHMLGYKRDKLVEFKAAYITKWEDNSYIWPEIIFHGKRGTPYGMAQFTPYFGNYFQLHGMTKDITLFEDSLVECSGKKVLFPKHIIDKIYEGWQEKEVSERTKRAIFHMAEFIPTFKNATTSSKPLYGAQQIPGVDPDLRAVEVSYEGENYARCEIVKVSSIFSIAKNLSNRLKTLGFIEKGKQIDKFSTMDRKEIDLIATSFASKLGYPKDLGRVMNSYRV